VVHTPPSPGYEPFLWLFVSRSIHDVKATDMGADTVRFKAEVNFDGREVAKILINKLDLEKVVKVCSRCGLSCGECGLSCGECGLS